jgi:outer membrane protein OmpA-like peptidoglycan-associated protein
MIKLTQRFGFIFLVLMSLNCVFAQIELDTVNTFDMEKMSKNINSTYHEGGPIVSPDGKTLYFFRTNHPQNSGGAKESQDIWFSKQNEKGEWSIAENIGTTLNRYQSNQVFAIVDNGNTLLISGGGRKNSTALSLCSKVNGQWAKPIELDIPDFEKMNKGKYFGASMSNDKKAIIFYFSEIENSLNSDLYVSTLVSEYKYTKPLKLDLSTPQDDLSPFICNDNNTLYYSSGRKGGMGQVDIYEVKRLDETWQKWSAPVNMGKPLNSSGFDAYFTTELSFKNAYLTRAFMSSDGGSLDVWKFIKRPVFKLDGHIYDAKTKKPIETSFTLEVLGKGSLEESTNQKGFYESKVMDKGLLIFKIKVDAYEAVYDTLDLRNKEDIASFSKDFYLKPHPKPVLLSGVVYNKKTNEPIGHAKIEIESKAHKHIHLSTHAAGGDYDTELPDIGKYKMSVHVHGFYIITEVVEILDSPEPILFQKDFYLSPKEYPIVLKGYLYNTKTNDKIAGKINYISASGAHGHLTTDEKGNFKVELPEPGTYKLYVAVPSYMAKNDTANVYVPTSEMVFEKNIPLDPIEVGASVRLNEIYFDFNKATLRSESFPELKRVIDFMNFNKSVVVELSGHTDNWGSDDYNQDLSQRRAESVVNYLIKHGVDAKRLEAKGYGETVPSVPNDTDENRQYNRRVQFTILKV